MLVAVLPDSMNSHAKLTPGWVLVRVKFDPNHEISWAKVGGGGLLMVGALSQNYRTYMHTSIKQMCIVTYLHISIIMCKHPLQFFDVISQHLFFPSYIISLQCITVESDNALLWMCYKSILSLIESWTDKSSNFCKKITHSSFFIQHIHYLNELIAEEDSEVSV